MSSRIRHLSWLWIPLVLGSLSLGCSSKDDCDGCTIDGVCVPSGGQSPDDPCLVCDPEAAPDGYSPRDCSDGVACNGLETCNGETGACDPGAIECPEGEFCDEEPDLCVVSCTFCSIDRFCYTEHQRNPLNQCQVCRSTTDAYGWTDNDGAVCEDGLFCNGADTCQGASCSGHDGDPCGDDGLFCNGAEQCDEEGDVCVHADDACGEGQSCDEDAQTCCDARDHLDCDANGDVVWRDSCGQAGEVVQECPEAPGGSCSGGQCVCNPGWMGAQCDQCIVFVRTTGSDSADGSSWSQAKATIRAALTAADTDGCGAVWVADGTYITSTIDDSADTFALTPGLLFYGGFVGTETAVDQRDVAAHPTVLDGEIGDPALPWDNACVVVTVAQGALVDGFTIRGGGSMLGCAGRSGGLVADSGQVTVAGCTFIHNGTSSAGQAALVIAGSAQADIRNTLFQENAAQYGALQVSQTAHAVVTDCIFRQNQGSQQGVVFAHSSSEIVLTRCQFESNVCGGGGSILTISDNARADITSCTFVNNTATWDSILGLYGSSARLTNVLLAGNEAYNAGAIAYNGNGVAILQNCTVVANTGETTGGIHAQGDLFIMRNSVVWGNTSNAATVAESQLLHPSNTLPSVRYSTLEGATVYAGNGNLNSAPLFVNDDPGAGPLDLHLGTGSPCIDTGSTGLLLPDDMDLDGDGDLQEPTPLDLDDAPRVSGAAVDRGAFETP